MCGFLLSGERISAWLWPFLRKEGRSRLSHCQQQKIQCLDSSNLILLTPIQIMSSRIKIFALIRDAHGTLLVHAHAGLHLFCRGQTAFAGRGEDNFPALDGVLF